MKSRHSIEFKRRANIFRTPLVVLLLVYLGMGQPAYGAGAFQINGCYLGATPRELGVRIEDDFAQEKFHEAEKNGVQLFFVRVQETMRAYRIIREETVEQENIKAILDSLKDRYGSPDRQQIKTSSVRPRFQMKYVTIVKNRAIWNISESQEFIAEVEPNRIVYELIDHDPEQITARKKPGSATGEEFTADDWDPDY